MTPTVLVAGAGPAGLVTAIELARHGIPPIVVERHATTSIFPRATGVSTRSMEILRAYGLEEAVRRGGWRVIPRQATVHRLDDREPVESALGFPDEAEARAVSPTMATVSPQDHLEPLLVEHLRALGGDVRFSTELAAFTQDARGVSATLVDPTTGATTTERVAFLVAADGHQSPVREALGIPMRGPADLGRFHSLLFRADLDEVLGERRYGLYQVGDPGPDRPPTVVVPSGADDRFVLAIPLPPGMDDAAVAAAFPLGRCIALVREAAGRPDLDVELLATSTFAFSAQVAARWRDARVFLVGDAAHRMTPRGGRGMNTAIADGHALGWRLAWVARGLAGEALLDGYEAERGPIGRRNVELSMVPGGGGTDDGLAEDLGPIGIAPGQRAPHSWLDEAAEVSTLDRFGGALAIVTGLAEDGWAAAVAAQDRTVPVRLVAATTKAAVAAYGLERGGAVLVRPDGHVAHAWTERPGDPDRALRDALDATLARPATPRRAVRPEPARRVAAAVRASAAAMDRGLAILAAGLGPFPPMALHPAAELANEPAGRAAPSTALPRHARIVDGSAVRGGPVDVPAL